MRWLLSLDRSKTIPTGLLGVMLNLSQARTPADTYSKPGPCTGALDHCLVLDFCGEAALRISEYRGP